MFRKISSFFSRSNPPSSYPMGIGSVLKGKIYKSNPTSIIQVGKNCLVEGQLITYTPNASLIIEDDVFVGSGTLIGCAESIRIGHHTLISFDCILQDSDAHHLDAKKRVNDTRQWMEGTKDWTGIPVSPIVIGPHVWIGARSIILKGIEIGEGAIVGAGSVVVKNVEPYTVVAGNPAQFKKKLNP